MLFPPAAHSIAHNPAEAPEPADATAATRVLAALLARAVAVA